MKQFRPLAPTSVCNIVSHPPVIRVAAGLVFRGGTLLIAQRRPDQHLGGFWEFPGGKLEPGESPQACLVRELDEELGIEVQVLDLIDDVEHAYPEKTVSIGFYRCAWTRHEPRALQCAAVAWITQSELADFQFPPADARLLSKLSADSGLWIRSGEGFLEAGVDPGEHGLHSEKSVSEGGDSLKSKRSEMS